MIAESPALLAREQQIFERHTRSLADLIALELGADSDDLEPWSLPTRRWASTRRSSRTRAARSLPPGETPTFKREHP
jgi:hypothetical protein